MFQSLTKNPKGLKSITTVLMALLLLTIAAAPVSATVSGITVSDQNDGKFFYGEPLTVSWYSDSYLPSYISIKNDGNLPIWDDVKNVAIEVVEVQTASGSNPYSFTYTFTNKTVNATSQSFVAYVNDTGSKYGSGKTTNAPINAFNVAVQNLRSSQTGNSTIAGDTLQVYVTTSGVQQATVRDGLVFTLGLPEGGNTVSTATNVAGTGNYTFTITATKDGVGISKNLSLTYATTGGFTYVNSSQIARYASGNAALAPTLEFNVAKINVSAFDVGSGATPKNIAAINIESLTYPSSAGVKVDAISAYDVNVTLTNSITDFTKICFNQSISQNYTPINNYTVKVQVKGGAKEIIGMGNVTYPVVTNGTISVTSLTAGTISAASANAVWTANYNIAPADTGITITAPTKDLAVVVGDQVKIEGWTSKPTENIFVNVTGTSVTNKSGTLGTFEVWNATILADPLSGMYSTTWDTNATWKSNNIYNTLYAPAGTYTVRVDNTTALLNASQTVVASETIVTSTNVTSVNIDDPIRLNITTNRRLSNGTTYWYTITSGSKVINNANSVVVTNYNPATKTSFNNLFVWTPNTDKAAIQSLGVKDNTANIEMSIKAQDNATSSTTIAYVTDSISVNSATGVTGKALNITGTTARADGCGDLTFNVYDANWNSATSAILAANVNNHNWFIPTWNATLTGQAGGPALAAGTYTMVVNDTIVRSTATLTLGSTGTITVNAQPSTYTYDGIAYISGSTNLPATTYLSITVTNSEGKLVNQTFATVDITQKFNLTTPWQINKSVTLVGNYTQPSTTYTINATNGSYYGLGSITLVSSMTVSPSKPVVVSGDKFNVTGTSDRVAGTQLVVSLIGTNLDVSINNAAGMKVSPTGTFSAEFYATRDLTAGGIPLGIGAYTIKVNDSYGLLTTASTTLTIGNPEITIVSPKTGSVLPNGTNITVMGTSNRGLGTNITITKSGINYLQTNYTSTDAAGNFTFYWDTTAVAQGMYYLTAANGTASSTIELNLAQPGLIIKANPTTVIRGIATPVTFTVTSNGTAVNNANVTLTGVATGYGLTDVNGTVTLSVNATDAGTITATATKSLYPVATTTITASLPPLTVTASPTTVTQGITTPVKFTVKSSGADVTGANVTLSGAATGSGTTVNGTVTINVNAATAGTITATATKTGYSDGTATVEAKSAATSSVGVWRSTGTFYLDGLTPINYGLSTDKPLVGDWTGTGTDKVGVWRSSNYTFYLKDKGAVQYGTSTDTPLVGHWAIGAADTPGVWRAGSFFFGSAAPVQFGLTTDTPLVGDFDGDGVDKPVVWRAGWFYFQDGSPAVQFGLPTDKPFVWFDSSTGKDKVGVWRSSDFTFYFDGTPAPVQFGLPTDTPLVGTWM